jgi:hypothetical protein
MKAFGWAGMLIIPGIPGHACCRVDIYVLKYLIKVNNTSSLLLR